MMEIWKAIPSCPGYEASSAGRVRNVGGRYSKNRSSGFGSSNGRGYLSVSVRIKGKAFRRYVHRMVCEAFHGEPPTPRHQASHRNGMRGDNRPSNLRWKTQAGNEIDKIAHGTKLEAQKHPRAKLTDHQVRVIRFEREQWGAKVADLATDHRVSEATIYSVISRRGWASVEQAKVA